MKKVNLFVAGVMMAGLMFTSCLGDGSNTQSAQTVGVVRYDIKTSKYLLDTYLWGTFYSPTFNSASVDVREGACYYFEFTLDSDLPENNSSVVNEAGYYTVTTPWKYEVSKYSMSPVFSDTSTLLTNEIPLLNPIASMDGYVKGIFFIVHTYNQPEDQSYAWNLSYNTQDMVVVEGSSRIYDVFLRATISGSAGIKTPAEEGVANAYDMKYFIERAANTEKDLGKTSFGLRFNYVSEIDTATHIMTWKQSNTVTLDVATMLAGLSD